MRGVESTQRSIDYDLLTTRAAEELERGRERHVGLQLLCDLLQREVPHYDWFGFYLAVPEQRILVLGPYQGAPTDHVRIAYGQGICGQVAESQSAINVADVRAQSNYLSCSIHVRSELVVPVFRDGAFVAQIDIDSHTPDAFDQHDLRFIERLAEMVIPHLPQVQ